MRKLTFIILVLIITIVGCTNSTINNDDLTKSNFNLLKDYSNFQKLMSESDTILVWMNLSVCLYYGMETFIITKEDDSLSILLNFKENAFSDKEYVEQKTINISVNDTIWGFGRFLNENKYRIKPNEKINPNFTMCCDTSKLQFYTYGISDLNNFIIDYCIAMKRLNPENTYYPIADIGEIEIRDEIEKK